MSSSSESVEFLAMIHQVSSGVSYFSEFLEFSPDFLPIFVSPHVMPLAVSKVRLSRKPMSFFPPSLRVEPSESVALHFPVAYDETPKQIAICNDNYKFVTFSHSTL